MSVNIGTVDRALRVLVGLALIAWALGYFPGAAASVWGWFGLVPLLTGLAGYCPAYALIGVDTCKHT